MTNKMFLGGAMLLLAAGSALGADSLTNDTTMHYDQPDRYRGNELSVDAFGSASLGKYTINHLSNSRVRHNTRLGVGLGVNYFFSRYVGLGIDAYSENTTGAFIDSASASLILRLPLGQSGFAPYVFAGGGHQFDPDRIWFAQVGGGMEYRFTPHIGVFVDARWVVPDETKYYGVGRLGMRFAF
ncbi:MAG: hypothetical protein JWR69_4691 [Pedosphaera sp.]|nr:hypothetical protein [Pedosphaera sp.]